MYFYSSPERSVGYGFLMRARVQDYHPTSPFHKLSEGVLGNPYPETYVKPGRLGCKSGFGTHRGGKSLSTACSGDG